MDALPQIVLSYASPIDAATANVPTAMDLTFERPSVTEETILYAIALTFCFVGLAFVAILFVNVLVDEYASRDRQSKMIASVVAFAVIAAIVVPMTRAVIRLRRFGDSRVRIVLDNGVITVTDPVRLGCKPLIRPLGAMRVCSCVRRSMEGGRYSIHFSFVEGSRWRRKRVDVAVHERGIVERIAADLQRAIDRANGKN